MKEKAEKNYQEYFRAFDSSYLGGATILVFMQLLYDIGLRIKSQSFIHKNDHLTPFYITANLVLYLISF